MLPASSAAKVFPTSSDVAVAQGMVTNVSTGFLPRSLSQVSTPDQPPPILRNHANPQHLLTTGSSTVMGRGGGGWQPLVFHLKKIFKDNQRTFFFLGSRGRMEKGEKKTGKKNQSTIQWYIPNFCHSAQVVPCSHSKVHGPRSAQAVWVGLSEEQQLGLCLPQVTEASV